MRDIDPELLIPLAAILGPMLLVAFITVVKAMREVVCHWRDVSLKMRLNDAGVSANEITQIVNAGRRQDGSNPLPTAQPLATNFAANAKPPIQRHTASAATRKPVEV